MRFKRRYFCVELVLNSQIENKIKSTDLSQEICRSIEKFFGDFGVALMQPSFSLIYYNWLTNLAVFRIARDQASSFHQLLTFMRSVESTELTFKVIRVSGSIKKCKKFLLQYSNVKLEKLFIDQSKSANEPASKAMIEVFEKLTKVCEQDGENFN